MNLLDLLRSRFATALADLADDADELALGVLPSQEPRWGDYQANCAMQLARRLKRPPREVAQQIVERLDADDLCQELAVAGPGFINLRVSDTYLARQLARMQADPDRLGVEPAAAPRTVLLDYSAPNVAKPLHVGHIRSTVIGDSLQRLLTFLGHRTISDNHIGDWGTQFGMIIYGYKHFLDEPAFGERPVEELARIYRLVRSLIDHHSHLAAGDDRLETDAETAALAEEHKDIGQQVLAETAKLHAGDPQNRKLWQQFLPHCMEEIERIYRRLDVDFDHTLGESTYHDRLAEVVLDLTRRGLARKSEGAICVFLDDHDSPMIIQKQDGAFLYATTDLATIQYRMENFNPDAILYVVDHRQALHFNQLFAVARKWGYEDVELTHVRFGSVLGEDGRPFQTRSGDVVGLWGLLDQAVHRAEEIVSQNDDAKPAPELDAEARRRVAEVVGIGALKYADLAHNRESDYEFSYDKMLAMKGNTATYMQYSYARVRSIFARGGIDPETLRSGQAAEIEWVHPAERALGLKLVQLSEALQRAATDYRPNHLTAYLYELATAYSDLFEQCPVLKAETDAMRHNRLVLCDLTARTLKRGLNLLGIDVVERM